MDKSNKLNLDTKKHKIYKIIGYSILAIALIISLIFVIIYLVKKK